MKNLHSVVLSLAVLSVSVSCGTTMSPPCTAASCAGCCDVTANRCEQGNADRACGSLGNACVACLAGYSCVSGVCRVPGSMGGGSGSTAGGTGATAGGTGATAGGSGATAGGTGATAGGSGATAGGSGSTAGGTGATAGGTGATAGGTGATAGGTGGTAGGFGGTGGGAATCDILSCTQGCCSNNVCYGTAMQSNAMCGQFGQPCMACSGTSTCNQGTCMCSGCIDMTGNCRGGPTDNMYCGANGMLCQQCDTAQSQGCMAGRCVGTSATCNPQNCPDGCCSGTTCVRPTTDLKCGIGGATCQACPAQTQCESTSGTCIPAPPDGGFPFPDGGFPVCDAMSCPNGCCQALLGCLTPDAGLPGRTGFAVCGPTGGGMCSICLGDCSSGICF